MRLESLLEAYAGYEKRALALYRELAERLEGNAQASRLWRQMSDAEASHFTTLQLASDWITMAGERTANLEMEPAALEALAAKLDQLEAAAEQSGLALQEAVELTLSWEELELPRIVELLSYLPEPVRGRVRTGLMGESARHYADLLGLVNAAGVADLAERVEALRIRAGTG